MAGKPVPTPIAKGHLYAEAGDPEGAWEKSAYSNPDNCVLGKKLAGGGMALRDSMNPDRPALAFDKAEWDAFRRAIIDGQF